MAVHTTHDSDRQTGLAELAFDDGSLIIYDRANHEAWLQTDSPATLVDAGDDAGQGSTDPGSDGG